MTESKSTPTVRTRVGALAQKIYPNLDERIFFSGRDREVALRAGSSEYQEMELQFPAKFSPELTFGEFDRPTHVVVVPQEGSDFESWAPGTRNFYYEAAQSLRELMGDASVSVFHVAKGEPYAQWHRRLTEYLISSGATHLITHIESDPGSEAQSWTWDSLWTFLSRRWDGILLGVMFDSAYRYINAKSKYLARVSPRFMVVDICMPMNNSMKRGRNEVGPVNMPMSRQSLAIVDERIANIAPSFDISFMGVLYPYRVELLNELSSQGFSVAINPHRADKTLTADDSRRDQPSWIDYMAGLASSRATINFSRSSAGPFEQLKTRVIEAGLAGTFLLTDDQDRTRQFWDPGVYGTFKDIHDLPTVAQNWFADPERLLTAQRAFSQRSREIAHTHFWVSIDEGLGQRGLPRINF